MKNLLLTLSALVSIESKKIEAIRKEYKERLLLWETTPDVMAAIATSYDTICLHGELLEKTVELKHFIECSEDGTPIEQPEFFSKWVRGVLNKHIQSKDLISYGKTCKEYRKAFKSVMFVGFESVKLPCGGIGVMNGVWAFEVVDGVVYDVDRDRTGASFVTLKTFEDLAQATKENPLELR